MNADKSSDDSGSMMPSPRVYIVILNWNGWQDTIECLESILKSDYANYSIVVIDNASLDDSVERIHAWAGAERRGEPRHAASGCGGKSVRIISYDKVTAENGGLTESEQRLAALPSAQRMVLIRCEENLGFAGGCNVGIRYVLAVGGEYVWLLNNDTVIEYSALQKLISFMESHADYQGVTGQIRLYANPAVIWNCGGKLTLYGARRYYYSNRPIRDVPQHGFRKISFITGCAPIFRTALFNNAGLLSDLFFFGEEDFELSQRLKRGGHKLACLYDAVIYHKVGRTISSAGSARNLAKTYIYYLNRFIDMRRYWPKLVWRVWRHCYLMYIILLLKRKRGTSWKDLWALSKALLKDSTRLDRVSKATFEQALRSGFGYDRERE